MEGSMSGSVQIIMNQNPGVPKIYASYGSGFESGTLLKSTVFMISPNLADF